MQNLGIISVNLWQILISLANLTILFLLLKKFLYKPVTKMLEARRAEIDSQYSDAEAAKNSAEAKDAELTARLSHAKQEAEGIVKEAADAAKIRGDKIVEDAKATADGIIRQAETQAELEKKRAEAAIKTQIIDVSTALAEKM
ncbi:MAG: F0F1 ATP synthase subunit B, partial [Clostridia bacterium]|nr:F0F1 ATP synthase subunit B [Clostridia bacterium]